VDTQPYDLYISGPMTSIPDFNYPLFNSCAEFFRDMDYTVYSPAEIDDGMQIGQAVEEAKPWQYYMTKAIELQMKSNAWVGLPNWYRSKGAKREFDLAVDLQHKLFIVHHFPRTQHFELQEL
jgi:hypothetical protein